MGQTTWLLEYGKLAPECEEEEEIQGGSFLLSFAAAHFGL